MGMAGTLNGASVDNTAASQMSFGLAYAYTKRTETYITYSSITNGTLAKFPFNAAAVGTAAIDFDPMMVSFGVKHTF